METPPSIKEELTRKSLDQLESLLLGRASGAITEAQFAIGIDTLWNCVSGLAGKEFFELISMVKVNKNDESFRRQVMMMSAGGLHWILTVTDVTALSVRVYRNGGSPPKEIVCESVKDLLSKATTIQAKAGLSGYSTVL